VGIIAAGMDGIEHSIEPPVSVEENIYLMDEKQKVRHGIKPLPGSLEQTIHELSSDKVVASAIGKETTAYLVKAKLAELAAFNESVTDWERERYIDV
jgi:glutamine synthetase